MKLTIQQVHENNVVAKKFLSEVLKELAEIQKAKEIHRQLPLGIRILGFLAGGADREMRKMKLESALHMLKYNMELYFQSHYHTSGDISKYYSPDISFKTYSDRILWTTVHTYTLNVIPHPAKF